MLDLPLPLGPTTTAMPSSKRSSTFCANDLNPRIRTVFRYIARSRSSPTGREPLARLPCRFLLGRLLARARAPAQLRPVHGRHAGEAAVVVGPGRLDQRIRYRSPLTCQLLLQDGLVVDVAGEGVVDAPGEGLDASMAAEHE